MLRSLWFELLYFISYFINGFVIFDIISNDASIATIYTKSQSIDVVGRGEKEEDDVALVVVMADCGSWSAKQKEKQDHYS